MSEDIEYLPPEPGEDDAAFLRIIAAIKDKPDSLQGLCECCAQNLEFPTEAMGRRIHCPTCGGKTMLWNEEFMGVIRKDMDAKVKVAEAEYEASCRRIECPNCGSRNWYVCEPSKPWVLTPLSFTGIMLGAVANAMADRIFQPERICNDCGHRWQPPN